MFENISTNAVQLIASVEPTAMVWAKLQIFFYGFLFELVLLVIGRMIGGIKVFSGQR